MRQYVPSAEVDQALLYALEHIAAPAFVVSAAGVILAVNALGRSWLADVPRRSASFTQVGGPDPDLFHVSKSNDRHRYYLAVLRHVPPTCAPAIASGTDANGRLAIASRRWKLTPRQAEVLEQLSQGLSNAQIATHLGCAEATVEIHVSRILDRAGVDSRACLLATLLWDHA